MKKHRWSVCLLGAVCLTSLCVGSVSAFAEEPTEETAFFVSASEYTGSLTPDDISFDTGYCCVPKTQGEGGWYAMTGSSIGALAEMTDSSGGQGNTYDGDGHGIWWRQDFGIWDGSILASKWTAPAAGTVAFSGRIRAYSPQHTVLSVYYQAKDAEMRTLYSAQLAGASEISMMVADESAKAVAPGDSYYFVLEQNEAAKALGDKANANGRIHIKADYAAADTNAFLLEENVYGGTLTKAQATVGNGYGCVPDAKTEPQGTNNWYALYGSAAGDYKKMTATASGENAYWQGAADWNTVWWREDFGPDGGDDAIAMWRAPFNGTVRFSGVIYKDDMTGSDGVVVRAYNRKSASADSERLISVGKSNPFALYVNESVREVVGGEMYFFCINQGESSAFDSTKMFIKAEFTKNESNPGTPADDDIGPVTENPEDSIFNRKPSYALGAQAEYYAAPAAQGENGVWALYGKAEGKYYEMTASDDEAGRAGNHWKGNSPYNEIWWKQECGPDGGDDVIIAWRAPFNGKVRFTGKIFKDFTGSGSDGIIVKAYNRKTLSGAMEELFKKTYVETFEIYFNGVELGVISGEMYFFAIDQNGTSAYDGTNVWFKAEFTKDAQNPGQETTGGDIGCARIIDYTGYYGTEQGVNNWYYAQGGIEKYAFMEYGVSKNSGALQWNGLSDWQGISAGNMTPGKEYGSLRIYVCDRDGVISVEGKLNKTGSGGDGMNAKIYHNDKAIFTHAFGAAAEIAELPDTLKNIAVKKGDLIVYYGDCGDAKSNDYDNLSFMTEIFWESGSGEAAEDTSAYISPVSKLELQGIHLPEAELDENEEYADENGGCSSSIGPGTFTAFAALASFVAAAWFRRRRY